jgi:hypothetical protein
MSRRRRPGKVTVWSTTGTAPITFHLPPWDPTAVGAVVRVDLEDGSSQVYDYEEMLMALLGNGSPKDGLPPHQSGSRADGRATQAERGRDGRARPA